MCPPMEDFYLGVLNFFLRATEGAAIRRRGELKKQRRCGVGELERRIIGDQIGHDRRDHQQIRAFHGDRCRRLQPIGEKTRSTGGFDEERWRDAVSSMTKKDRSRAFCARERCNHCPTRVHLAPILLLPF
uniref:Uncharacterized protein n=1 Tax=Brassica campestris TaxID=3711 RepID=M4F8X8_BRACM